MKKHPSSYKLNEPLKTRNEQVKSGAVVLYDGKLNLLRVLQVIVITLVVLSGWANVISVFCVLHAQGYSVCPEQQISSNS